MLVKSNSIGNQDHLEDSPVIGNVCAAGEHYTTDNCFSLRHKIEEGLERSRPAIHVRKEYQ